MMPPPEFYTCAVCRGRFEKAWSDDEAAAESRARFRTDIQDDPTMAVVCDDCFKTLINADTMREKTSE
jgi:hypothetical protein